ncbi:ORF123 [Saltwater crocodilepox virus]|nr:ORF123 [Saltwater crocodilepox virus]
MSSVPSVVNLSPVFVEPSLSYDFLGPSSRYAGLLLFQIALACVLVWVFLGDEVRYFFERGAPWRRRAAAILDPVRDAELFCDGPSLKVRRDGKILQALNYDGSAITFRDCQGVLSKLNGSQTVPIELVF